MIKRKLIKLGWLDNEGSINCLYDNEGQEVVEPKLLQEMAVNFYEQILQMALLVMRILT